MKTYLTILFIAVSTLLHAQNFVYENGQDVRVLATNETMTASLYFKTPTPETITMHYRVVDKSLPPGWFYSLCGYGTCEIGIPDTGVFFEITKENMEKGESVYFILNVTASSFDSCYVKLYVYDNRDFNRGDTVSIKIISPSTLAGVESAALEQTLVYPTPANDKLQIDMADDDRLEAYTLSTAMGEVVQEAQSINRAELSLNVSGLTPGMYTLRLFGDHGIIETRKVVIQR